MACPRCGCRLVSPSRLGSSRLVCSDCGAPLDSHLRQHQPLAGWTTLGIAALLLALGLGMMGLLVLRDGLSGEGESLDSPSLQMEREHSESGQRD